jgi:hypothetical protein
MSVTVTKITAPIAQKLAKEAATAPFVAHLEALAESRMAIKGATQALKANELDEAGRQIFFARRSLAAMSDGRPYSEWASHKSIPGKAMSMPDGIAQAEVSRGHAALTPIAEAWDSALRTHPWEDGSAIHYRLSKHETFSEAFDDAKAQMRTALSTARGATDDAVRAVKQDQERMRSRFADILDGKALIEGSV